MIGKDEHLQPSWNVFTLRDEIHNVIMETWR